MSTAVETPVTLAHGVVTTEFTKALKRAKFAAVSHVHGVTMIRVMVEKPDDPFHMVAAMSVRHTLYQHDEDKVDPVGFGANGPLVYMDQQGHERTALLSLRAGDEVQVMWMRDDNNAVVKRAGLHVDECHLVVKRKEQTYRYLLESRVSPDNSARMIRARY